MLALGRATREYDPNYLHETFDEVRQSILDVFEVATRLNCQLLIRPHPAFAFSEEWINSWLPPSKGVFITKDLPLALFLDVSDVVIVSKSAVAIEAVDRFIPTIVFSHEHREVHFLEEISAPIDQLLDEGRPLLIRAAGFEGLLKVCRKVLYDRTFSQIYRETCRLMDPWIFHNRDGQQVRRIAEFMADIIVENKGVDADNRTENYNA
ncbi:hypothetical protein MYX75_00055 [Acidobacteria bacterium AH-259-A15]|nr:hypothetical protein [Acidobacteria bacterium AH-259-A15]